MSNKNKRHICAEVSTPEVEKFHVEAKKHFGSASQAIRLFIEAFNAGRVTPRDLHEDEK